MIQVQIQVLIVEAKAKVAEEGSNTGSNIEVAKPLVFNGEIEKVRYYNL